MIHDLSTLHQCPESPCHDLFCNNDATLFVASYVLSIFIKLFFSLLLCITLCLMTSDCAHFMSLWVSIWSVQAHVLWSGAFISSRGFGSHTAAESEVALRTQRALVSTILTLKIRTRTHCRLEVLARSCRHNCAIWDRVIVSVISYTVS